MLVPTSSNSSCPAFLIAMFTKEFLATCTLAPTSLAANLKASKFLCDVPL
jgi:hypothetical protein